MSNTIQLDSSVIFAETTRLRAELSAELRTMEVAYAGLLPQIDRLDSATNARLRAAMAENLRKKQVVAETLDKLLSFIANSTVQIEWTDRDVRSAFVQMFAALIGGGR